MMSIAKVLLNLNWTQGSDAILNLYYHVRLLTRSEFTHHEVLRGHANLKVNKIKYTYIVYI